MPRKLVICIFLAMLPGAAASAQVAAQIVKVTAQQVQRLGIHTVPVRSADTQATVSVLGHIAPAPDSRIPVAAPFAGAVVNLLRLEGETVRKGDPLAVIASADMHAAQARLRGQEARFRSTKAAAERARALVTEGIAPASRAEQANAEASAASADLAASRNIMAQAKPLANGGYQLLAPAGGRIASIDVSAGDQVAAMQSVLSIDTRQELWVEGALPAGAIGRVAAGDSVLLEGAPGVTGVVVAAGTSIDPKTRAATVRARLGGAVALVSGQTVRLSILRKAKPGSFSVPRAAVVQLKQGPVVFAARPGGFEAVAVRVLARGPKDTTVQGHLATSDAVAISGVSELKAASIQD